MTYPRSLTHVHFISVESPGFTFIKKVSFNDSHKPDPPPPNAASLFSWTLIICLSWKTKDLGIWIVQLSHVPSCRSYTISLTAALAGLPGSLPCFPRQEAATGEKQRYISSLPSAAGSLPYSASSSPPSLSLTAPYANHGALRGTFSSSGNDTSFSVRFVFLPPHTRWVLSSLSRPGYLAICAFCPKATLLGFMGLECLPRIPQDLLQVWEGPTTQEWKASEKLVVSE